MWFGRLFDTSYSTRGTFLSKNKIKYFSATWNVGHVNGSTMFHDTLARILPYLFCTTSIDHCNWITGIINISFQSSVWIQIYGINPVDDLWQKFWWVIIDLESCRIVSLTFSLWFCWCMHLLTAGLVLMTALYWPTLPGFNLDIVRYAGEILS